MVRGILLIVGRLAVIAAVFTGLQAAPGLAALCSEETTLLDYRYLGVCGHTKTTTFALTKQTNVSRIRIWYDTSVGGTSPSATLVGPGGFQRVASTLPLGGGQWSWREALWSLNETLNPGTYTLTFSSNSVCANPSGETTLVLYGCQPPASAPQAFAVTANSSGSTSSLSLSLDLDVDPADVGRQGSLFLAAYVPNVGWYLHNGSGWQAWGGGALPAYFTGTLPATTNIPVLSYNNVEPLKGTEIYAGYGRTAEDMLSRGLVKLAYILGQVATTVDPSRTETLNYQGELSVKVPKGLLSAAAELRISPLLSPPASVFPGLETLGLYSIALGDRNTFNAPLTLEFAYPQGKYISALKNGGLIVAGWNSDLGWFTPPQRIDATRKVLQVDTEHLSRWGLFVLSGFATEDSPQGKAIVYYQPGGTPPNLGSAQTGYSMVDVAETVGTWADQILANYKSAGFTLPSLPVVIVLAKNIQETEWDPKTGYIYLKTAKAGSVEELRHDLAHEIFHAIQNTYYNFLSMSNTLWWIEASPDYAASRIGFPTTSLHAGIGLDFFETPLATAKAPGESDALHAYSFAHFWDYLVSRRGGNFKSGWDFVYSNSSAPTDASRFSAFKNYAAGRSGGTFDSLWSDFVDASLLKTSGSPGWNVLLTDSRYRRTLTAGDPLAVLLYPLQSGYTAKPFLLNVETPAGQNSVDVDLRATIPASNQRVEVWKSRARGEPAYVEMLTSSRVTTTVTVGAGESLVLVGKNMSGSWVNMMVEAKMKVAVKGELSGTFPECSWYQPKEGGYMPGLNYTVTHNGSWSISGNGVAMLPSSDSRCSDGPIQLYGLSFYAPSGEKVKLTMKTSATIEPKTGEHWDPNYLQRYINNYDDPAPAPAKDIIIDSTSFPVGNVSSSGDSSSVTIEFTMPENYALIEINPQYVINYTANKYDKNNNTIYSYKLKDTNYAYRISVENRR